MFNTPRATSIDVESLTIENVKARQQ